MIRKITLGLTALLSTFSLNSLAAPRTPIDVNVPSYNGGLTFGLAGLYLRPSADSLVYGLVYPGTTSVGGIVIPNQLINGSVKNVNPDYDLGFRANIGYVFPCSGNDVNLTYTHFKTDKTEKLNLREDIFFGSITPAVFTSGTLLNTEAKSKFSYQAVDLDLGQHINVGCYTHFRFLAGLRYVDLDHTFDTSYRGTVQDPASTNFQITTAQKSEFHGIGPRFGIDTEISLGNGFGIVGQTASALLVGDFKNKYNQKLTLTDPLTVNNEESSFSYPENNRVIPNLSAKLGLNYNYQFSNSSRSMITIEAGYQVDHFFNAVDRIRAVGIVGGSKETVDANFAGPYVGIQVHV